MFKLDDLKAKLEDEINLLIRLNEEVHDVINTVPSIKEQLVLRYRHCCHYTWEVIGDKLSVSDRTVRRWHKEAISHITIPENAMNIEETLNNCPEMS